MSTAYAITPDGQVIERSTPAVPSPETRSTSIVSYPSRPVVFRHLDFGTLKVAVTVVGWLVNVATYPANVGLLVSAPAPPSGRATTLAPNETDRSNSSMRRLIDSPTH